MYFSTDQKIKVVQASGLTVKIEEFLYFDDNYREEHIVKVHQLYKDGKKVPYDFEKCSADSQLNDHFNKIMAQQLTDLVADKLQTDRDIKNYILEPQSYE